MPHIHSAIIGTPLHSPFRTGVPNECRIRPIARHRLRRDKQPVQTASVARWYNCYTSVRFQFDERKSKRLKANPRRAIGFDEVQEIFLHPYYLDQRADELEQFRAIGWVGEMLYTLIFEIRQDERGEYCHLVTLWKATRQEQQLYEENS